MRIDELLQTSVKRLDSDNPRLESELLLAFVLQRSRTWLYAHNSDELNEATCENFLRLLGRREHGEPIALITGQREFWSLDIAVSSDTLIPRPETELLVELALAKLPRDKPTHVLDLGTGSGVIALAIARERPLAKITAVDASASALLIAQKNAARLDLAHIQFLRSDWYSAVRGERFDVVVSNPPYLADDDPHLQQGDLRFEPRSALASGPDGLDDIHRIVSTAPAFLTANGWVLIEHGWQQGAAVREIFAQAGLLDVETVQDLEARDRVTCARSS